MGMESTTFFEIPFHLRNVAFDDLKKLIKLIFISSLGLVVYTMICVSLFPIPISFYQFTDPLSLAFTILIFVTLIYWACIYCRARLHWNDEQSFA